MKKIEKGCKAITVNCEIPENNGKIVFVEEYLGKVQGWEGYRWRINIHLINTFGYYNNHLEESQLKRIDEYDGDTTISWSEMRDIWTPEQITANQ